MRTREEIENVLIAELDRTKMAHDKARKEFNALLADIPSGLPYPDGTLRMTKAGRANTQTMDAYARALREFNAFIIDGSIPERLKKP
jgi:hypothetical protein